MTEPSRQRRHCVGAVPSGMLAGPDLTAFMMSQRKAWPWVLVELLRLALSDSRSSYDPVLSERCWHTLGVLATEERPGLWVCSICWGRWLPLSSSGCIGWPFFTASLRLCPARSNSGYKSLHSGCGPTGDSAWPGVSSARRAPVILCPFLPWSGPIPETHAFPLWMWSGGCHAGGRLFWGVTPCSTSWGARDWGSSC